MIQYLYNLFDSQQTTVYALYIKPSFIELYCATKLLEGKSFSYSKLHVHHFDNTSFSLTEERYTHPTARTAMKQALPHPAVSAYTSTTFVQTISA